MLSVKQLLKKNGENIFAWAEDRFKNYLTNWEWNRISVDGQLDLNTLRVDVEILESAKKNLRIQNGYPDTRGWDLRLFRFWCSRAEAVAVLAAKTPYLVVEPGLYTLSMQVAVETSGFTARTRLLSVQEYRVTSKVLTVN